MSSSSSSLSPSSLSSSNILPLLRFSLFATRRRRRRPIRSRDPGLGQHLLRPRLVGGKQNPFHQLERCGGGGDGLSRLRVFEQPSGAAEQLDVPELVEVEVALALGGRCADPRLGQRGRELGDRC